MYIMKLYSSMDDCPAEWENFIRETWCVTEERDTDGIPTTIINEFLRPYNAEYISTETVITEYSTFVQFQNEEDYIIYKLKYGGVRNTGVGY